MGSSLELFGLPSSNLEFHVEGVPKAISEKMFCAENQADIGRRKCEQLNTDQARAFPSIIEAVNDNTHVNRLFFLNAPGGYGKTLIEALLSTVRRLGKIALAVASSGIAVELLEGGRTAHSWFKIPIPINESSVCNISLQSDVTKLIQKTSLIIWDEIMMSHVAQVDCVDHSLQDIMKVDKPFGGIVVVFGGDPHRILPVVHHGDQCQIVQTCIHSSLWKEIQQLNLTINMRLKPD